MSDPTYTLEWRGAQKSGYSYDEIEAGLSAGDLHSLYKINVDGKWIVLRDFVERQRALALTRQAANHYAANQSYAHHPAPQPDSLPAVSAPAVNPSAPPSPAWTAPPPSPALHSSKAPKPVWFWPAVILSSTVCLLLLVVLGYIFATSRSSSQRTISESKAEIKPAEKQETKPDDKPLQAKFHPFSFTGREIYPSALIATATMGWNRNEQSVEDENTDEGGKASPRVVPEYGDKDGWMGFELAGVKKGAEVSVEITADGFMKPSKWHGTLTTVNQDGFVLVKPKVMWDFEALIRVHQQRPINVVFSASIDGRPLPDATEIYTMRSINDCPLYVKHDKEGTVETNLSFLFAAYVNENHPQVQEILKEALASGAVKQFDGYQSKEPKQVINQVFSIWNALQRRGIKYSSVTDTPPGDMVLCQSVRFLHESINNRQANCVDGSVLMASVLQKIGIRSYLVLVPSHCFLAFDLVPGSAALPIGLETTMLGEDKITDVAKLELLSMVEQTKENNASIKTFNSALDVGSNRIQSCARNLEGQGVGEYRLISIKDARQSGIMPIPFTADK